MKSGLYQLMLKVVEILAQLLKNQDKREERKKEGRKEPYGKFQCNSRLGSPLLILQVSLGQLSCLLIAVSPVPLPVPGMQQHATNICSINHTAG